MRFRVDKKIEPIISRYYRYGDTRHIFSDTKRLKSLGWEPIRGIKESIHDYWEYIHSMKDMDNILEDAEKQMKKVQVIRKMTRAA